MDKRSVYLDHKTTTPVLKEARQQIARMINAESDEDLIFTSGGTESSNLAIKGFTDANMRTKGNHIVVSAIEHPSVMNSVEYLTKQGFEVPQVPVDTIGRITPDDVA